MTPKEFWSQPESGASWIKRVALKRTAGPEIENTTVQSELAFWDEFAKRKNDFTDALEVGAGNGRLIGGLSKLFPRPDHFFYSVDINSFLSHHVRTHYDVEAVEGEVAALPFIDNRFDLVYTFQVLQHMHPDEIKAALKELLRVSKKEVWLMEGYDYRSIEQTNGEMTHPADGGSFAYYFDTMPEVKCYESYFLKSENLVMMDVKLYKIRK